MAEEKYREMAGQEDNHSCLPDEALEMVENDRDK
jgi:hypothetical protein